MDKKCLQCGAVFPAERESARFCKSSCRAKYNRQSHTKPVSVNKVVKPVITKTVTHRPDKKPSIVINKNTLPEIIKSAGNMLVRRCHKCKRPFKSVEYEKFCEGCRETEVETEQVVVAHRFNTTTWFTVEDVPLKPKQIDQHPESSAYTDLY